jgi:hypothetical protein
MAFMASLSNEVGTGEKKSVNLIFSTGRFFGQLHIDAFKRISSSFVARLDNKYIKIC